MTVVAVIRIKRIRLVSENILNYSQLDSFSAFVGLKIVMKQEVMKAEILEFL